MFLFILIPMCGGGLAIRQSRQLLKARHGAEASLLKHFLHSFVNFKHSMFRFYARCSCLCKTAWIGSIYSLDWKYVFFVLYNS